MSVAGLPIKRPMLTSSTTAMDLAKSLVTLVGSDISWQAETPSRHARVGEHGAESHLSASVSYTLSPATYFFSTRVSTANNPIMGDSSP